MNIDSVSLDLARKINDIFAMGHPGGTAQRTSKVQLAINEVLKAILDINK